MGKFTHLHSKFHAHNITLRGLGDDSFAKSLATARVDMNPHQVDAALFALKSPLSKGVMLADEVGLGKTIEASLIIAQKWAEQKRHILLIVPASLRKQWSQEISEKFTLPSRILDAKTYKEFQKLGERQPFDTKNEVVITSYEFAARHAERLGLINWDMVVYDEAHKLRNVYRKNGAKRAKVLKKVLSKPFKLLLTATPLQNSLMELYGLVTMIDDHHFGSEFAFRTMYTGQDRSIASMHTLRKRLQSISKRTLRAQVQEAGHINYTNRIARTFDFEAGNEEVKLYEGVSSYLQRQNTIAFGQRSNPLLILVARKTLGSSTAAIVQFLDKVISRLETLKSNDKDIMEDIEIIDDIAEELDVEPDTEEPKKIDQKLLKSEIAELKSYRDLALSIKANAKGEKLVAKLPDVMNEIVNLGGQRKAVIFTESVRTQKYLADLLNNNGYDGKIVMMNGSNNDPDSREIYNNWLDRHKGTDIVSGSRTADMKAAIVDAFRSDSKSILIATESGAEGVNLQFCSLIVNFDLPWNPQRVEQRIGRCHRYGQKIDVLVVNLLNRKNRAEERVYELLESKFQLFSGVFGASDNVLGIIESGVDFEKTVLNILQNARSDEEVQNEFDFLQDELQEKIDKDLKDARAKILTGFDENVVARLRTRKGDIDAVLDKFTQSLMIIAKAELPDAKFSHEDKTSFVYQNKTWSTQWPLAEEKGWQFFRLADNNLANIIVEHAKKRVVSETIMHLKFLLSSYPMRLFDVEELRDKSGWMKVSKIAVMAAGTLREELILTCFTDEDQYGRVKTIQKETAQRFFELSAIEQDIKFNKFDDYKIDGLSIKAMLDNNESEMIAFFREQINNQNEKWLDEESEKLDAYAEDLEKAAEAEIKQLELEIKEAKKNLRTSLELSMKEKLAEKRKIKDMEAERDDKRLAVFQRRKEIRHEVDSMLDEVADSLDNEAELEHLFSIRWTIKA